MLKNRIKAMLSAGKSVVGAFIGTTDPRLVEICGGAGFDYVLIDAEHYPFTIGEIENLARAADLVKMPTLVRVPATGPRSFARRSDAGAWGVMVPQVHDQAEAEAAVQAGAVPKPYRTRAASCHRGL